MLAGACEIVIRFLQYAETCVSLYSVCTLLDRRTFLERKCWHERMKGVRLKRVLSSTSNMSAEVVLHRQHIWGHSHSIRATSLPANRFHAMSRRPKPAPSCQTCGCCPRSRAPEEYKGMSVTETHVPSLAWKDLGYPAFDILCKSEKRSCFKKLLHAADACSGLFVKLCLSSHFQRAKRCK